MGRGSRRGPDDDDDDGIVEERFPSCCRIRPGRSIVLSFAQTVCGNACLYYVSYNASSVTRFALKR